MELTPREKDSCSSLRPDFSPEAKGKGLKLNYPAEAVAYLSAAIMEGAREGKSVACLMGEGMTILSRDDVIGRGCGDDSGNSG